ncbi:MAG: WG repeat-containing protein [Aureispira sp.]
MYIKATYALNIFVAYHPKDQDRFDEFWKQLDLLQQHNRGYFLEKVWYNGSDRSYEQDATIHQLTEAADIVLLLLSDNSIISPFFQSDPIKDLLEEHQNGHHIVLPVVLNTCWWEDTIFRNMEVLPKAGLPLYEDEQITEELYEQILGSIQQKLLLVRQQKLAREEAFDKKIAEAEAIYDHWEQNPAQLRGALPLYQAALHYWLEGFKPDYKVIEARIATCQREIDFRHYAKAALEAHKFHDYQTCFFNCKDALSLRDDAVIRRLYEKVSTHLDEQAWKAKHAPFEQLIEKAQAHFLDLNWVTAQQEFEKAIALHQSDFKPSLEVLERKIAICQREYLMESTLKRAEDRRLVQDYKRMADILLDSVQQINHEALYQMEYALKLLEDLQHVMVFMDEKSKKWGYLHKMDKRVLIPAKYNAAYEFTENLAGVKKWDRWGFIDIEGHEVIPFKYEYVTHFQNGVAQVIEVGGTEPYCINHRGEYVEADVIEVEVSTDIPDEEVEQLFPAKKK